MYIHGQLYDSHPVVQLSYSSGVIVASPVVQLRVPPDVLDAIDAARGGDSRSAWLLAVIDAALAAIPSPWAKQDERLATAADSAPVPERRRRKARQAGSCAHPPARVHKGLCHACGEAVYTAAS